MKVLLDEQLPKPLKRTLGNEHRVFMVRDVGWTGIKNGRLLKLMTENGFDVLVTNDKGLRYQQNFAQFPQLMVFGAGCVE